MTNPLNQFEHDQHLLSELKELFEFVPPAALRRSIEDIFFNLLQTNDDIIISKEASHHIYLMINFLNEVERIR